MIDAGEKRRESGPLLNIHRLIIIDQKNDKGGKMSAAWYQPVFI